MTDVERSDALDKIDFDGTERETCCKVDERWFVSKCRGPELVSMYARPLYS